MIEVLNPAPNLGFRIALFYGALFVVYGMHVPYTPVWLEWRGLSAGEISVVMALPLFLRLFVTPSLALAADRRGNHRQMLIWLAWSSLGLALLLSQSASFWPILLLAVGLVLCNSTIMPLTETIAVLGVRLAGLDYGRVRLWGSLTFVAASFAGGFAIQHFGGAAGIWLVVCGCVLTVIAAHLLPRLPDPPMAVAAGGPIWKAEEPRRLLASPVFVAFLLAAGGVQAAHATFLTFGTLIWQHQGLSGGMAGLLWAIGVFAEVALFAMSGTLIARFGAVAFLIAGAATSAVRWAVMAFDPPLALLLPLQLLHGATYGATHAGAIHFIHQAVPRSVSGSAQALYATVGAGLAMGIATLIAGRIYAGFGSGPSYAAMAVISLVSLAAAWRLQQIWDGQQLSIGGESDDEVRL